MSAHHHTKRRRPGAGRLAGSVFVLSLGLVPLGAAEAPKLLDLALIREGEGRFELTVKTSGTPSARCGLRGAAEGGGIVLDFRGADSSLRPAYEFPELAGRSVKVIGPSAGGERVHRVEIPLPGATIQGWEIRSDAVVLRFGTAPPPPAAAGEGAAYLLGIGDRLTMAVFGHDDLKQDLEVLADGNAVFPLVGMVPMVGRTLAAVRAELETKYREYLVDPHVSLDIREYRSQPVNVVGEVEKPGMYYLQGPTTLMDILATAGWMTPEAGNEIVITRRVGTDGSEQPPSVIRKEELLRGGSKNNPRLVAGDVVTVGPKQFFYIRGEVVRPGQYKLEDNPTLLKAVSIAAGLTPYARRKEIEVIRTVNGAQTKLVFDLKAIEERKAEDVPLLPGDVINVPRRLF